MLGQTDTIDRINSRQLQRQQFVDLVTSYRDTLSILYEDDLPDTLKRRKKQELQDKLRQDFLLLSEEWGRGGGYESWFANSLNNAQLSTVTSYNDLVPNFEKLLKQSGSDLEVFYISVKELAKLNETQRKAKLQ